MQTRGGGPQLWKVCSKRDVDVNAASMQNNSRRKKSSTNFSRCKASRCNNILQMYKTHDQGITYFGKVTKSHHQTNKFVSWYILGEIDKHIKRMNKFVWIENWIPSAKFIVPFYNFTSFWDQRVHSTKGISWRTDCPMVLAACHKLGQGDRVRSLHELSKSASVGEGQGQTKAFLVQSSIGCTTSYLLAGPPCLWCLVGLAYQGTQILLSRCKDIDGLSLF
jgi:hypothetical protein